MKTWNLGNTTVRNPERIKAGLRLLKEHFEGRVFNLEAQKEFFEALLAADLIEGNPPQERNRAASGRKWQSVGNKLGFVSRSSRVNGVIAITDAGNALLSDDVLESDLFLRQMLKVQLPSPTEGLLEGAMIHPFYLVLSVAVMLHDKGMHPLSREEVALFMQSAHRDGMAAEVVSQIDAYRTTKEGIIGRVGKRRYFLELRASKAGELGLAPQTLEDYSDTTMRYSAITGVFTIGRQTLVIKEDQFNLAKALVDAGAPPLLSEEKFFEVFHNPTLPALPTDDQSFLERDIIALSGRLDELSRNTGTEVVTSVVSEGASIAQLKRRREDLEQELIRLKEVQFYRAQCREDQVEDIVSLFESIERREIIGGSDYLPAWAEWGVWRVFLSINTIANPISETRGFKINSELYPIHHAKGRAADLKFQYADNTLIPAEITLNTGERQYAAEREPVRNHVLKLIEADPTKDVIGVFVAPQIQPRTAHDFFTAYKSGDFSSKLNKAVPINIVPLTVNQLCQLLPGKSKGCNNASDLRSRLAEILSYREECQDGNQWLASIGHYFGTDAENVPLG